MSSMCCSAGDTNPALGATISLNRKTKWSFCNILSGRSMFVSLLSKLIMRIAPDDIKVSFSFDSGQTAIVFNCLSHPAVQIAAKTLLVLELWQVDQPGSSVVRNRPVDQIFSQTPHEKILQVRLLQNMPQSYQLS